MKSNYRPKPEFLFDEASGKLLHNSRIPYHAKFVSENPDEFITSSNNGDGTHIAMMALQDLCKLMSTYDNQQKDVFENL